MSEIREKVASLLLEELKANGSDRWFYISVVHTSSNTFYGGYFLLAKGPTDAWCKAHHLNWIGKDCETQTVGPIDQDMCGRIPEDKQWRRITSEEVHSIK